MNKKTMRDILMVCIGGYVGWYLAMNEEKAVRKALNKVHNKALKLKDDISEKMKENEKLQAKLDQIKTDYTGIVPPSEQDVIRE